MIKKRANGNWRVTIHPCCMERRDDLFRPLRCCVGQSSIADIGSSAKGRTNFAKGKVASGAPSPEPLVTLAGEGFWNVTRQQSLPQQAKPAVQGKVAVSGKSMVCLGLTEEVVSLKRTINGRMVIGGGRRSPANPPRQKNRATPPRRRPTCEPTFCPYPL